MNCYTGQNMVGQVNIEWHRSGLVGASALGAQGGLLGQEGSLGVKI